MPWIERLVSCGTVHHEEQMRECSSRRLCRNRYPDRRLVLAFFILWSVDGQRSARNVAKLKKFDFLGFKGQPFFQVFYVATLTLLGIMAAYVSMGLLAGSPS